MTDQRSGHVHDGVCSSAPVGAATAVLVSIRWDALTPTDLLAAGLALRLIRRHRSGTADDDGRFAEAVRAVESALSSAAARWFDTLGSGSSAATVCVADAYDQVSAVLGLSRCRCEEEMQWGEEVLRLMLFGLHRSLADFLADRFGRPQDSCGPGLAALDHLVRAHAQLVLAAIIVDP